MKVGEFIKALQQLPADYEIAVLSHTAHARPPVVQRVNTWAWSNGPRNCTGGLQTPSRAFLVRPAREIIGGSEG
jgi:hypothetical protein